MTPWYRPKIVESENTIQHVMLTFGDVSQFTPRECTSIPLRVLYIFCNATLPWNVSSLLCRRVNASGSAGFQEL
jgi:hypothetical protein